MNRKQVFLFPLLPGFMDCRIVNTICRTSFFIGDLWWGWNNFYHCSGRADHWTCKKNCHAGRVPRFWHVFSCCGGTGFYSSLYWWPYDVPYLWTENYPLLADARFWSRARISHTKIMWRYQDIFYDNWVTRIGLLRIRRFQIMSHVFLCPANSWTIHDPTLARSDHLPVHTIQHPPMQVRQSEMQGNETHFVKNDRHFHAPFMSLCLATTDTANNLEWKTPTPMFKHPPVSTTKPIPPPTLHPYTNRPGKQSGTQTGRHQLCEAPDQQKP